MKNKFKILFFINGPVPTDEQKEIAYAIRANFRNAEHVTADDSVEKADFVYGDCVPAIYAAKYPVYSPEAAEKAVEAAKAAFEATAPIVGVEAPAAAPAPAPVAAEPAAPAVVANAPAAPAAVIPPAAKPTPPAAKAAPAKPAPVKPWQKKK